MIRMLRLRMKIRLIATSVGGACRKVVCCGRLRNTFSVCQKRSINELLDELNQVIPSQSELDNISSRPN